MNFTAEIIDVVTLSKLAIKAFSNNLSSDDFTQYEEIRQKYIERDVGEFEIASEFAQPLITRLRASYGEANNTSDAAIKAFTKDYTALGLDKSYLPVSVVVSLLNFLAAVKKQDGILITDRAKEMLILSKQVVNASLRAFIVYDVLNYLMGIGAYAFDPDTFQHATDAFEEFKDTDIQGALSQRPMFMVL